jgi:hypothetical protein
MALAFRQVKKKLCKLLQNLHAFAGTFFRVLRKKGVPAL